MTNLDSGIPDQSASVQADRLRPAKVGSLGASSTTSLAERLGIGAYSLEVMDVVDLAPSMRRLRVGASDGSTLAGFSFEAGQDLMLDVGHEGERTIRRRYSIRRFQAAEQLLDLDVVLHGEGPAARWATSAGRGTRLEAIGPRGKATLDPNATWHLFIGDETFVPAASAMLEAVSPECRAVALLEVDSDADARAFDADLSGGESSSVRFVVRRGRPVGQAADLLEALEGINIPSSLRHVYVAGEHHVVAAIRKALAARGFDGSEVSPKAYWRLGQANAEHGEPRSDG
jgi:NADPH-dependent ferric siderophore reductase